MAPSRVASLYETEGAGARGRPGLVHRRQGRSGSARRWNGWRRCRSSRSPAKPGCTATTRTSSAASSNVLRACRSIEFIRTRITEPLGMKDTVFPAGLHSGPARGGVHERERRQIVRAPEGPRGQGALCRRSTQELRRRCRTALDGPRLCAVPRDDSKWRGAGTAPNPVPAHRHADDDQSESAHCTRRLGWVSASASKPSIVMAPTAEPVGA